MKRRGLWISGLAGCLLGAALTWGIASKHKVSEFAWWRSESAPSVVGVYPPQLVGRPSIEVGDFILTAMDGDQSGTGWYWNWSANAPYIAWQLELGQWGLDIGASLSTEQKQSANEVTTRQGIMRLNVAGEIPTVLRETEQELGWDIALGSDINPSLGPDRIGFAPHECFGFLNGACSFDILPSLARVGIQAHPLCLKHGSMGGGAVYRINRADKGELLLGWSINRGSGGENQQWLLTPVSTDSASALKEDLCDLEWDDVRAATRRQPELVEKYRQAAIDALKQHAAELPGTHEQHCQLRLVLDGYQVTVNDDQSYEPLCDAAIQRLEAVVWPYLEPDEPAGMVAFDLTVLGGAGGR